MYQKNQLYFKSLLKLLQISLSLLYESGHIYLSNDSQFAIFESQAKKEPVSRQMIENI